MLANTVGSSLQLRPEVKCKTVKLQTKIIGSVEASRDTLRILYLLQNTRGNQVVDFFEHRDKLELSRLFQYVTLRTVLVSTSTNSQDSFYQ